VIAKPAPLVIYSWWMDRFATLNVILRHLVPYSCFSFRAEVLSIRRLHHLSHWRFFLMVMVCLRSFFKAVSQELVLVSSLWTPSIFTVCWLWAHNLVLSCGPRTRLLGLLPAFLASDIVVSPLQIFNRPRFAFSPREFWFLSRVHALFFLTCSRLLL
jgi:hypothetical protein